MANNNNDWRSKVKAMMTDPDYAKKMSSAVDTTRKINTDLMNKSEENYPAPSLTQPTQKPLDLSRVESIKAEEVARATAQGDSEDYSGVADLATRLYAEERKTSIDKANKQSNTSYSMTPHGMQFSSAASDIRAEEQAKNIQKIYGRVLENKTLYDAIHANANRVLLKAMEKNQSMTDDEKKKVYEESVGNQLNAIGNSIDKYLYDVNAPKSELEWIAKNAINSSVMGQMLTSAGDVEGGENVYRQQAIADYGKDASWWAQGLSTAGSLIMDTLPMSGITTAIAQPVSRATMWGVGRIGGRALQNSILGKAVAGMAGGSATLGGYNAVSTLTTQFNNGYFNADELLSSTGHGLLLGGLTGGMTPWLRGVSANMGKVGKVGTMAGGLATEAGIFTASELSEMDNPYDLETIAKAFGKNVAVIGGLKVSNLPKTIGEYKQWYNEGKQSNFTDSDYKVMADFAKANGYANEEAFTMNTDGTYKRSIADRVTGNRTLLEMTKLQGGREHRLAIDMFSDPNVPLSLKTKIAAKMGWQAPAPVLANGVRVEGNKAITYYTLPDGRQQVIDIKEFKRPRNARAFANEFGRTTARRNDLLQSEAFANEMASQPIILARLNEQAKRNGTSLEEETAKIDAIFQRLNDGTITKEDVAYYNSIFEGDATATDAIKETIKAEQGVDIDEVLRKEGSFTDAEDKALTAYGNALRGMIEKGNPTTERTATAAMAGIADYVVLNNLGIMQTTELMANPTKRAEVDAQMRGKYAAWLKFFDGKMGEDALAERLGYNLDNTSDLQSFLAEQSYFKTKAADRIASRTVETAKAMLENGGNGVRFTEDGKVKLKGVPYAVGVNEDIVARYEAAMNGSGEPMSRIVNDALKDIIKQGETPVQPKEPIAEETPTAEEPMNENEAITQQMVDSRLAEIDADLQGIQADGVQRMTINGQRAMVVKGRIVADINGQADKTKSSTEVAYMPLDENGRPILDENGRPKIEVGVKPSNIRVEDIEPWRRVDEYKASEEQRIRENNRITDESLRQAGEQMAVEEPKAEQIIEPQTTDEMLQLCNGDRELAIDVATDELNRAMQSKGKGATPAETMEINKRIRMYQQMLTELSRPEQSVVEAPKEQAQEPQVTKDMEFVYQQGLDENHDGMEPMQTTDGRYKWVGLQRGELTANMGERDVELLDNLAKKLGVAVIPINVADRAVNGYYKDGNIYVNTNRGAEWTMRWVAGHEMLHDVAKKSPEAYDAYKQAVLDMWGSDYIESQVKQIIEDYKASGKEIDREQALTELVNDFGGDLFSSRDGLKILDNILKDQSSKGNTGFIDTIKKWWENIKEFFGVSPYANEVEKKLADAYKSAMKVMVDRMGERKVVEQQGLVAIGGLKDEAIVDDAIDNEGAEMSIVRDRNKIDELEGEELVPMYRTFQVIDGRLYPPMAAIQAGKKVHSIAEGDWWKSDENPDLALVKIKGTRDKFYSKDDDRISKKDGQWVITIDGEDKPLSMNGKSLSYYFNLKKGEKGDVATDDLEAAYNPYIHASKSALNDQFKGAYLRPNLVLVEILVPKSEIDGTNRYKADYAKDGIGFVPWNSGDVIKQAVAAGHPGREVALSRYAKIGRVFSNAEWADHIDAELAPYKDKIVLPFVMFPPEVLRGLANKGYKIEPPTSKKAQPYYEKWLKGEQPTDPNGGDKPIDAEFSVKRRFGGNSGYVGYSKSVRAVDAEERGLRSVSKMDADFKNRVNAILADNGVDNPLSLAEIKRIAKGMKGDEWHHTSMYGNRTEYYSAESIAEKIMGKQSETAIDPRISARLERMSYRESLADKMKTDRDIKIEVDLGNGKMHTYTVDAFRSSDGLLFDIGKALREEPIEKQSQINILNTGQVDNRELYLPEWYINDHSKEITKAVAEYNSALAKAKQELDAEFSIKADKQKQLDIINRTNPAHDDYHTWIRTTDDIKTLQEAVDEVKAEDAEYNLSTYPDVTDDMINEALQSGKITIYSSKPIKEGAFVSPSKMQAKDYAGGGRIYSKQVPINDVAWINTDEGMFAPVEYSVKGKRADESVLDYAKRMREENAQSLPTANAKQSKSNSQLSVARFDLFDDADFSISKGNRATIEGWLNKRSDLSDKERGAVIDYIDKLDSAQVQLATGKWFANGAIRLPEDMPKVEQAAKVAKKAKVDMLKYASPMELINTHADLKIKGERINPHDVAELKSVRSIPQHGIEIFDVEDSKKGQQAMRKIINTHWGEDANPWCLLQGDGKGNLTKQSWEYWNYYNGYPKRVAFKDGKLLAFSANDSEDVIWWDRNDESHEYIPIVGKVPNDRYGRSALMEVHDDGQVDYSNFHIGNKNKNGAYMRWDDDGELIQSGEYKDGKFTGWKKLGSFAVVYKNGESYHRSTRGGIMDYSEFTNADNVHYTKEEKSGGAVDYRIANRGETDRPSESISTYKRETTRYDGKEFTFIDAYGLKMYNLPADSDIAAVSVDWKTNKSKVKKDGVNYELDSDGNIEKETHKIPYRSFKVVVYRRPDGNVQHVETIDGRGKRTGWVRYFYTTDGEKRNEPLDKLYDNGYPYNRKDIPSDRIEFDKKWLDIDFVDSKELKLAKDKAVKNAEKFIKSRSKAIIDEVESEVSKVGNIEAEVEQMKKRDIDALNQKYAEYSIARGGKTLEDRLNSKRIQTRLNAAKELGKDYPEVDNILNDLEPSDINEVVAATLGSPDFKLRWEDKTGSKGLQKHLGLSDAEKKGFRSMISSSGFTPEEAAHQIWRGLSEEMAGKTDTMEILGIVLDYARSYTKRELREMIANNRIDTAIDYARKQAEWDAAQEQIYLEGLTEAERASYLANKAEQEKIANMTEKQKAKYFVELQRKQMLDAMTPEERAEYEAKEKWRRENAGAITSSFFAERRADKADKIQALKDEINKLIRDTRAVNDENKAKVKEIAKKMREFIEESIPAKNQDDMTNIQFNQVLAQLANATTRKQLEGPMRMVDYIGANVNRRALTRQMEDFLKKGFKGMTPKGLVKAKMVDGATSRVLGLTKSLYSAMSKKPLGSELRALQTNVRGIKAELEEYNEKNGGQYQEYVDQIDAILKKSGVDRHEEMVKYHNELLAKENIGEVLDYVRRLLPELFNIELVKEQRTEAKINSALNTKEDLEQLKNSLADKEEKGILSEEDKAVMDNIALYELMIDLHQRQLDIDGPGASSIASQMAAKVEELKTYKEALPKKDKNESEENKGFREKTERAIALTEAEIDELFVQLTQAQKEVNTNTEELLTNLKELRDDGISKLQEWSKAKNEREKQIVTMANESFGEDARGYWSEVDKRGKGKRDFVNWLKNQKLAFLMSPAMSFEYMLGVMDPRYYTNESPIYKQFIKGNEGLIKANDNYFVGLESYNQGINEAVDKFIGRTAMTNLKDYFKRGDRYATEIIPFAFEVSENKDGEIVKSLVPTEKVMTRGQAAKIYAWSRMADGMAKLKAHGVTDDTMDKVKEFIGEDYMNFIDWVEDVYFPKLRREKYNPIYKQMYGISMAENEHYFPFLIYQKDVRTEQELEQPSNDKLGGGVVGNLVERTRNNARLDFTAESPDIFDMITDYGKKMEEWAAYAQVREDLKKVVNNKQFKQHCDMLGTHYYKYFLEAAQVASRLYNPQPSAPNFQKAASKVQKVFASAAISLRVSTALKQLLSAPAFVTYSLDPAFQHELIKTVEPIDVESTIKGLRELANGNKSEAKKLLLNENWVGHYNWCVENLPSFRERVAKQGAGNPILEERGFSRFSDDIQAVGMMPNRLVDAFTCSVGAKAIYEYTFNKFKKNYDEKTAHNMAVTEAEIAFNTSQQSSNPVFLAPMQASKQFFLRGMMNYKNSPIGYYRNAMKANIDLYRATKALFGQPKFTINGEEKGFESGGKKAISKAAEAAAKSMMFNFFLNAIWNFGTIGIAGLSYKIFGNSNDEGSNPFYTDEEIKKVTGDNMALYLTGSAIQGIPWLSGFLNAAQTGQEYTPSILFSELNEWTDQVSKDGIISMATAQFVAGALLKGGAGIDPEVWGQIYRGAQGIMADRPMRAEDFMNLIASPRSAISGVAKQKVGQYDNIEDYVNSRIESEREIGANETLTFEKRLVGLRKLKKSKLDGYIDEYLADKIPDYREIANKPDEMAKKEKQERTNILMNAYSVQDYEKEKESKRKDNNGEEYDGHTKDVLKKVRKAVNVIHKIYAFGDAKSAQRIADELERRIKRGYNPDGATLDERLKGVDIYDSTGTTEQRSQDGYDTLFDRAMLGGFNKTYLGNDRLD